MTETPIRPTGALRAWGWPLLAIGAILTVGLFSHPYIGFSLFVLGLVLLVMATKRAASNREVTQRETLARLRRDA